MADAQKIIDVVKNGGEVDFTDCELSNVIFKTEDGIHIGFTKFNLNHYNNDLLGEIYVAGGVLSPEEVESIIALYKSR